MLSKNEYQELGRDYRTDGRRTAEVIQEGFAKGHLKPSEFSIKKLAQHLVEDGFEWVESLDPRHGGGYQEAAGAISLASFSNITGQIIYNSMLEDYQPEEFVFSGIVPNVPTSFSGERVPGIGGLGDKAAIVGEGDPYPLVGVNEDYIDTPQTTKRGFIVPVTKEAIFFDRTNLILTRAAEVGTFLRVNKEKRIINAFIDENETAYRYTWKGTAYATYQSTTPWVNLKGSNGLTDWNNLDAALLVMSQIVDPNTGEPVVNMGSDLVVCPQLVATAERILHATMVTLASGGYATTGNLTGTQSPNPILGIPGYSPPQYKIRTSRLLATKMATKTSWFIGDVAKTVKYRENWPITVVQAPANSQKEFEQDIVAQFKASERGTASVENPRYIVKSTVA